MSALDLFQHDQADAMRIRPEEGRDLPATFGQTFEASWNEGALFSQSIADNNAHVAAVEDYRNEVREKTGYDFAPEMDPEASGASGRAMFQQANAAVSRYKAQHHEADVAPLSADEMDRRAVAKSQAARAAAAAMGQREKTLGGSLGSFAGSAASAAADPINILALPLAPEAGIGVLATALRWGAIGGVAQAGIEVAGAPYREQVQPGYAESGQPGLNVLEAAGGAAALGVGTKALGHAWTAVKGRVWPQSIRDAGNVIESEANAASGNPMPGAEGEVAHRDALTGAIDNIAKGEPVDVSKAIPPELAAGAEDRFGLVAQARREENLPTVTAAIQDIAREAGHDMPAAEAESLAQRVIKAPDDEARATLADVLDRPRTAADFPTGKGEQIGEPVLPPISADAGRQMLASPDHEAAVRADIDRARATGDVKIPAGVDEQGEPVFRSVDAAMEEVDAYKAAAAHIQACANPQEEAAE